MIAARSPGGCTPLYVVARPPRRPQPALLRFGAEVVASTRVPADESLGHDHHLAALHSSPSPARPDLRPKTRVLSLAHRSVLRLLRRLRCALYALGAFGTSVLIRHAALPHPRRPRSYLSPIARLLPSAHPHPPTQTAMSSLPANVHISNHPCLRAKLSQLRSNSASSRDTKALIHEIATIVGVEALASALQPVPSGQKVPLFPAHAS